MSNFRQREILELARKDGKVTVDGLAEAYNVTVQTIRRDLSELAESGKLERVHGGAVIPSGVVNIVYDERRRLNEEGKRAIAEHCAHAIPHGASVFMNIGTSTEAVAQEMLHHENLLVVTNNLNIANILAANQSCEIILTGGVLRRADGGMVGGLTAEKERRAAAATVRKALVATAILMALSPSVLAMIYSMGARGTGGMLLAVFVAFFPASVLVSFPSPFLAKLAVEARPGREGSSLGLVLAAGSLGAIFGAILAGFVTLPLVGSVATFAGCGAAALICVLGVRAGPDGRAELRDTSPEFKSSMGVGAVAVVVCLASGSVCRYESGLSCIDVARQGSAVYLYSDGTQQAAERRVVVGEGRPARRTP